MNFEAALRVSYTSNILSLKKKLYNSEIEEANFEALKVRIEEKGFELAAFNKEFSILRNEHQSYLSKNLGIIKEKNALLEKLETENAALKARLEDASALSIENESFIKDLKTCLNYISSENEALTRHVQYFTHTIEDNRKIEMKLEQISKKLQAE